MKNRNKEQEKRVRKGSRKREQGKRAGK